MTTNIKSGTADFPPPPPPGTHLHGQCSGHSRRTAALWKRAALNAPPEVGTVKQRRCRKGDSVISRRWGKEPWAAAARRRGARWMADWPTGTGGSAPLQPQCEEPGARLGLARNLIVQIPGGRETKTAVKVQVCSKKAIPPGPPLTAPPPRPARTAARRLWW